MGSFSFLKADNLTKVANVRYGAPFKFLIPQEFGGGFVSDRYRDCGALMTENGECDMYEILAIWNADTSYKDATVRAYLRFQTPSTENTGLKAVDSFTDSNRRIGIDIGCYDVDICKLKYPLKLVSPSYKGTYETCVGRSFGDPYQGSGNLLREKEHREHDVVTVYLLQKALDRYKLQIIENIPFTVIRVFCHGKMYDLPLRIDAEILQHNFSVENALKAAENELRYLCKTNRELYAKIHDAVI